LLLLPNIDGARSVSNQQHQTPLLQYNWHCLLPFVHQADLVSNILSAAAQKIPEYFSKLTELWF
jgi:hypothetical protein